MQKLLTALVLAKQSFDKISKDKTNPRFGRKYASLDSILTAIEPALLANGLTLSHTVIEGSFISTLYHQSGESLSQNIPIVVPSDPQQIGSCLTYFRRYGICSLLSVAADEDDDAESAKIASSSGSSKKEATKPLTASQLKKAEVAKQLDQLKYTTEEKAQWGRELHEKKSTDWSDDEWEVAYLDLLSKLEATEVAKTNSRRFGETETEEVKVV